MAAVLEKEFSVSVTPQTSKTKVDGLGFTIKNKHYEPQYINKQVNKEKRCNYLRQLLAYQAEGKAIYSMDETNYCLWISRNRGWSKSGNHMIEVCVAAGGGIMYVSACIGVDGLVYVESRFGSNKGPGVKVFVHAMLQALSAKGPMKNCVLVADNEPSDSKIEEVFQEPEFLAATLLRLGLYSSMFNPIESVFSSLKAKVKSYFQQNRAAIVVPLDDCASQVVPSARLQPLLAPSSSADLCAKSYRHTAFS